MHSCPFPFSSSGSHGVAMLDPSSVAQGAPNYTALGMLLKHGPLSAMVDDLTPESFSSIVNWILTSPNAKNDWPPIAALFIPYLYRNVEKKVPELLTSRYHSFPIGGQSIFTPGAHGLTETLQRLIILMQSYGHARNDQSLQSMMIAISQMISEAISIMHEVEGNDNLQQDIDFLHAIDIIGQHTKSWKPFRS